MSRTRWIGIVLGAVSCLYGCSDTTSDGGPGGEGGGWLTTFSTEQLDDVRSVDVHADGSVGFSTVSWRGEDFDTTLGVYEADGSERWSRALVGEGVQLFQRSGFDPQGRLIAVGHASETVDFGGQSVDFAPELESTVFGPATEAGAVRYATDGTVDWARKWPGSKEAYRVAVDDQGDFYAAGCLRDGTDFGLGPIELDQDTTFLTGFQGQDGLAKWQHVYDFDTGGSANCNSASAIAATEESVVVCGLSLDGIDLGDGEVVSGGVYVARYGRADGQLQWSDTLDVPRCSALASSPNGGGFLMAGEFRDTATLGDVTLAPETDHEHARHGFLARFRHDGSVAWAVSFGASIAMSVHGLAADDDRVVVAGSMGTELIDQGRLGLDSEHGDIFVHIFSVDDGELLTTHVQGGGGHGASHESGKAAAMGPGFFVVGGQFRGADAFPRFDFTYSDDDLSDGFLLQFDL